MEEALLLKVEWKLYDANPVASGMHLQKRDSSANLVVVELKDYGWPFNASPVTSGMPSPEI